MTRLLLAALIVSTLALKIHAQDAGQPGSAIVAAATPISQIKALKDFQVELLYSVPKREQGSWVNMCVGPKGRSSSLTRGARSTAFIRRRLERTPSPASRRSPSISVRLKGSCGRSTACTS